MLQSGLVGLSQHLSSSNWKQHLQIYSCKWQHGMSMWYRYVAVPSKCLQLTVVVAWPVIQDGTVGTFHNCKCAHLHLTDLTCSGQIGTKMISKEFIPITPQTVQFVGNPAAIFKKGPSMYANGCQDRYLTKGLCERLSAMVKVRSSLISLLPSVWSFFWKLVATVELTLCLAGIFILQELIIWFVQPQIGHTCYWHPYSTSEAACRYKYCLSLCLWRCRESGVV